MDWFQDHKPLSQEESTFMEHKDDFVAISDGQECGWLDGVVEDTLNICLPSKLMKVHHPLPLSRLLLQPPTPNPLTHTLSRRSSPPPNNASAQTPTTSTSAANAAST